MLLFPLRHIRRGNVNYPFKPKLVILEVVIDKFYKGWFKQVTLHKRLFFMTDLSHYTAKHIQLCKMLVVKGAVLNILDQFIKSIISK